MSKQASQRPPIPELGLNAHDAPQFEEAFALLNNYFSRFHTHHSFLVRDDVFATFNNAYASDPNLCLAQDRFRLFMIFAISGVTRYRAGLSTSHPYGYYLSALRSIDQVSILGSADAIQNLLLIARFGMYYHVGISLWDIAQSCMRQCVELGFYKPSASPLMPFEEQKRRRIFWECYILDRYTSSILGRPFAIADSDISIDLPVPASDESIRDPQVLSLSQMDPPMPGLPAELSVFVFCIKLRRISSDVRTAFQYLKQQGTRDGHAFSEVGDIQVKVDQYIDDLDCWRCEAPVFAHPASLYERAEWYDFLLETDRLALFRAAMHASPKRSNGRAPSRLLRRNLASAARAIELYSSMLNNRVITWTRSYFQTIFTAGMSIIYCLSFEPGETDYVADAHQYWPALTACLEVLDIFKGEMPDASIFTTVFTESTKQLLRKRPSPLNVESQSLYPHTPQHERLMAPDFASHDSNWTNMKDGGMALPTQLSGADAHGGEDLVLTEDLMQSIEADLGQYACGFPGEDLFNFERLDWAPDWFHQD